MEQIRSELIRWEGYRTQPYRDGNHWSVGVGHNLTAHRQPARSYNRLEIEQFFLSDLEWAQRAARRGVRDFDLLPDDVQVIVLSLIWSVGGAGFQRFHDFRTALHARSWRRAASELRRSLWARQVAPGRLSNHVNVLLAQ